jgi:hypothetical protein
VVSVLGVMVQGGLVAGFLSRTFPAVRDRLISDPRYLYKVFIELAIDSCALSLVHIQGQSGHCLYLYL